MDHRNIFAQNLNHYMKEAGKTRRDISEALKISYFTISEWCNGNKYPRIDKIEKLAYYFGIEKSDLIEDKKEKPIEDDGLSENQRLLIQFAQSVPEEKAAMVLRVLKSILEDDE